MPYRGYVAGTLFLNILAAILNVFSFTLLLPILNILFKIEQKHYELIPWSQCTLSSMKEVLVNNGYYYSQEIVAAFSPATALLLFGAMLAVMTLLKTGAYFGGSATLMPIKTGIVRDIRAKIYRKILHLPLSFFTEERKGDILARVSTDVNEVDGHDSQESYFHHYLSGYIVCSKLAIDSFHPVGSSFSRFGNRQDRQEVESQVTLCPKQME